MSAESSTGIFLRMGNFKPTLTLSSLLALTQAASFYKLSRPRMVSENVVRIKGGR